MEPLMTASAVFDEIAGMDAGTGVRFRQDVMGPMTVGATGHQGGLPDTTDLAVVSLFIKLDGVFGNAVAPHHGFVGVAMVAFLGVEGSRLDGIFFQGGMVNPCVVKAMAIAAVRSIPVAPENGLRMPRSDIFRVGMAGCAFFNGPALDFRPCPLPVMNVPMAVCAVEILL